MSSTEVKFAVRGHVRALDDMTADEAFPFFQERMGDPDDIDSDDEGVQYFRYEAKKNGGWAVVNTEAGFRKGKWGIDFVLLDGYEHKDPWPGVVAIPDLAAIAHQMTSRFGVEPADIVVTAYTWYNGVDEPITLERPPAVAVG